MTVFTHVCQPRQGVTHDLLKENLQGFVTCENLIQEFIPPSEVRVRSIIDRSEFLAIGSMIVLLKLKIPEIQQSVLQIENQRVGIEAICRNSSSMI